MGHISTEYYPNSPEEGLAYFRLYLAGKVQTVGFELLGAKLVGINAEPALTYSEVVSFSVPCKDQAEVDVACFQYSRCCGWYGKIGGCECSDILTSCFMSDLMLVTMNCVPRAPAW